jgi:hypothetical protein
MGPFDSLVGLVERVTTEAVRRAAKPIACKRDAPAYEG